MAGGSLDDIVGQKECMARAQDSYLDMCNKTTRTAFSTLRILPADWLASAAGVHAASADTTISMSKGRVLASTLSVLRIADSVSTCLKVWSAIINHESIGKTGLGRALISKRGSKHGGNGFLPKSGYSKVKRNQRLREKCFKESSDTHWLLYNSVTSCVMSCWPSASSALEMR